MFLNIVEKGTGVSIFIFDWIMAFSGTIPKESFI